MLITMTQEDIENGKKQEPKLCPIALAVKREFSDNTVVWAEQDKITVYEEGSEDFKDYVIGENNSVAQVFMEMFDSDHKVIPLGTVELRRV